MPPIISKSLVFGSRNLVTDLVQMGHLACGSRAYYLAPQQLYGRLYSRWRKRPYICG